MLKCSIPSFVADFVYVDAWIDEEATVYTHSDNYGVYIVYTKFDKKKKKKNTEGA